MNPLVPNEPSLVAACGLYCGACGKLRAGKCEGCAKNEKATWCKVRSCVLERGHRTCADCSEHADVTRCAKFQNPIRRVVSWFFGSNLPASIARIREVGPEGYAADMTKLGRQALPRK